MPDPARASGYRFPPLLTPADLAAADLGRTLALGSAGRVELVAARLGCGVADDLDNLPADLDTLVAVGGGRRLDRVKVWRARERPGLRLIAVPTLWGSGAENSPIAVLDHDGDKEIQVGPELLPDARCVFPELALAVPEQRARDGFGDTWSHALEGFLSPLADDALRAELAGLIRELAATPLARDAVWFELSARACAGQARSGVGLVHGIAHRLEAPLRRDPPAAMPPGTEWGHAALCALFVHPVMAFNQAASCKLDGLFADHGLPTEAILARLRELHDPARYAAALPVLVEHWRDVLRDPCTRTNSALVRPAALDWFTGYPSR